MSDLKALFDLTLPGYLGNNQDFAARYLVPIQENPASPAQRSLSKLIHPFVLRRLKKSVLEELPPKIEDVRTCRLSTDQVGMYREAIDARETAGGGAGETTGSGSRISTSSPC